MGTDQAKSMKKNFVFSIFFEKMSKSRELSAFFRSRKPRRPQAAKEAPSSPRRTQEPPGELREPQEAPGLTRSPRHGRAQQRQREPRSTRSYQEPQDARRPQEAPGERK